MLTVVLDAADQVTIPASILGAGLDVNAGNNADVAAIGTLPVTGSTTGILVRWGVVLVMLGAFLVLVARRRRHPAATSGF
jgi:LPXTG-motif cell wall-anchored protein